MANGIGKIAMGRRTASSLYGQASSRAPMIGYQMDTQKREENAAFRNQILSSLASVGSGFKENTESWGKYEAGQERAGLEVEDAGFLEKMKRGFGLSNVDLSAQHEIAGGRKNVTGAELMNIGEKQQTGTLESFLEGKEIGDMYGTKTKGFEAFEYAGPEGSGGESAQASGQSWENFRDKQLLGKGVERNRFGPLPHEKEQAAGLKKPYDEETYAQIEGAQRDESIMNYKTADQGAVQGGEGTWDKLTAFELQSEQENAPPPTEISQEQWESQATEQIFPDPGPGSTLKYGETPARGPKDPLRNERLKISQGIEEGALPEGTTMESWNEPTTAGEAPPQRPYVGAQSEEADIAELSQSQQSDLENFNTQMEMGDPLDPFAKERSNVSGSGMSLEDIWKKQDELQNMLKGINPETSPAASPVSGAASGQDYSSEIHALQPGAGAKPQTAMASVVASPTSPTVPKKSVLQGKYQGDRMAMYLGENRAFDDTLDSSKYTMGLSSADAETGKSTYSLFGTGQGGKTVNYGEVFSVGEGQKITGQNKSLFAAVNKQGGTDWTDMVRSQIYGGGS